MTNEHFAKEAQPNFPGALCYFARARVVTIQWWPFLFFYGFFRETEDASKLVLSTRNTISGFPEDLYFAKKNVFLTHFDKFCAIFFGDGW